jgi:hypothetical protein
MFAVTLGTSRLLPNSKGLTLIMTTASVASLSFILPEVAAAAAALLPGFNKTSWAGTLLKLNRVPSKGLLTFCKFWGSRRWVALSEFSCIHIGKDNIELNLLFLHNCVLFARVCLGVCRTAIVLRPQTFHQLHAQVCVSYTLARISQQHWQNEYFQ